MSSIQPYTIKELRHIELKVIPCMQNVIVLLLINGMVNMMHRFHGDIENNLGKGNSRDVLCVSILGTKLPSKKAHETLIGASCTLSV